MRVPGVRGSSRAHQAGRPRRYRALYGYVPQHEDELELREGDTVLVVERCDDGWYLGSSLRTGLFGTFPGNYALLAQVPPPVCALHSQGPSLLSQQRTVQSPVECQRCQACTLPARDLLRGPTELTTWLFVWIVGTGVSVD
ncbi:hypothetical protein HPB48_026995 [Haemaphysalis longicornis]|uniref:SH3 domain-containing protein n=1 Tax=Haemaphysalis longicornis TaxID=44386 RepID=A0A9J6HC82_HAELO|nr:hypothetical protein HPB48_026995 [Haemaphysalis longicornis]